MTHFETPSEDGAAADQTVIAGLSSVQLKQTGLKVTWTDGRQSMFSLAWLRDWSNTAEDIDRREVDSARFADLDLEGGVDKVEITDSDELLVKWAATEPVSTYSGTWLRQIGHQSDAYRLKTAKAVSSETVPAFAFKTVVADEDCQLDLLEDVRDHGFALVQDVPKDPDQVAKLGACLGYIPGGWRYTAQSEEILVAPSRPEGEDEKQAELLAMQEAQEDRYLQTLLVPHTDFSFTSWPTGLFIFHCLSPSADGGGATIVVDGFAVAEKLRKDDPKAFEILSMVKHRFRGHGPIKGDWYANARMISTDHVGTICGIRFALGSRTAQAINQHIDEEYTKATQAMLRLVLAPENQLLLPLKAGDCLVMDNHRILHGRTGMDPGPGASRWFRRFDVERDAAQCRMQVLARRLDRDVLPLASGAHG